MDEFAPKYYHAVLDIYRGREEFQVRSGNGTTGRTMGEIEVPAGFSLFSVIKIDGNDAEVILMK